MKKSKIHLISHITKTIIFFLICTNYNIEYELQFSFNNGLHSNIPVAIVSFDMCDYVLK